MDSINNNGLPQGLKEDSLKNSGIVCASDKHINLFRRQIILQTFGIFYSCKVRCLNITNLKKRADMWNM